MGRPNSDLVAGLDEAGLGPIAGPALFGVVVLRSDTALPLVRDSKKLSNDKKYAAACTVMQEAVFYDVVSVPVSAIDVEGVGAIWRQAMYQLAFSVIAKHAVGRIVVDGNKEIRRAFEGSDRIEYMVKADDKVLAVSAASVLAKCEQLERMEELHEKYPEYGFGGESGHHGYGVEAHAMAIQQYGAIRGVHRQRYAETLASNRGFELKWRRP